MTAATTAFRHAGGSPRRTQAERRAETQGRLLDATVACLTDKGYAGTSTNEVAERAGVSRGAMLHHFPTKAELAAAAVERLLTDSHAQFLSDFQRLPAGTDKPEAAIDLLWELFQGPAFAAWLELMVAARLDPDARQRAAEIEGRFHDTVAATFVELFSAARGGDDDDDRSLQRVIPALLLAVLEGLGLQRLVEGAPDHADAVLDALKGLGRLFLPGPIAKETS